MRNQKEMLLWDFRRSRDLISNPFHEEADGYVLAKCCGGRGRGGGNITKISPKYPHTARDETRMIR